MRKQERRMIARRVLICGVVIGSFACLEAGSGALNDAISKWAAPSKSPAYRSALTDLNADDIADAIVLLSDPRYCGSGGCELLVLKGSASGFEVISSSTITREPIYLLPELRSGWHTLSVLVGGGGAPDGQALMRFNGKKYPGNPSVEKRATAADLKSAQRLTLK
jgi:hypothetical protein